MRADGTLPKIIDTHRLNLSGEKTHLINTGVADLRQVLI